MKIKNKICKIIILSILFIFPIHILTVNAQTTWKDFSVNDYRDATASDAGSLQGYLQAVSISNLSKEELEKYIKCVNALVSSEGGRSLDVGLTGAIKTKANEANTRIKELQNGGSTINDQSWGNYVTTQEKIEEVSTREDAGKFYRMLVNPNPSIDQMSDWFAEQYIIMINKLLKSPGFALYEQENPLARAELTEQIRETRDAKNITDSEALDAIDDSGAGTDAGGNAQSDTNIYKKPERKNTTTPAGSLDDMLSDADSFVESSQKTHYAESELQQFSKMMFNIGASIGTAIALIVGVVIGIKYMMGSAEAKADYKKMLIPYLVGCIVVFGAFGIWKIVLVIAESIA
ncbi:MAG: hypothetical protein HFJ33_01940 [Clostridia bacterium]|nr:hypothetical protein [Clostridia bacterium]